MFSLLHTHALYDTHAAALLNNQKLLNNQVCLDFFLVSWVYTSTKLSSKENLEISPLDKGISSDEDYENDALY